MKNTFLLFLLVIASTSLAFAQAPVITDFNPKKGPIGTEVTFVGTGFHPTPDSNIVYFGATKAKVLQASTTQLIVNVPNGATYQYPSITNLSTNLTAYIYKIFNVTFKSNFTFSSPKIQPNNYTRPISVHIGDMNSDSKPDLILANYGTRSPSATESVFTVLKNISTDDDINMNKRYSFDIDPYNETSCISDFDSDGKLDVATYSNKVLVYRNTSTIDSVSFAPKFIPHEIGSGAYTLTTGDLDLDGKPEILGAGTRYGTGQVFVIKNNSTIGNLNFSEYLFFDSGIGSPNPHLCIGDLDGDQKPEIAIFNNRDPKITILRNTSSSPGTISFAPIVQFPRTPSIYGDVNRYAITMGDIDSDGKLDIIISNGGGNTVSILRNISTLGSINFEPKVDFTTSYSPYCVAVGDIDGDGKPDLATANQGTSSVSILLNRSEIGTVNFLNKTDINVGLTPYSIAIGDLNADGKADIATAPIGVATLQQTSTTKGSLYANGPFCGSGIGKLTFLGAAGSGPYTITYNDGIADRTVTNINSGIPFNVATNPLTTTTTYRLISITNPDNSVQTSGFDIDTATITVQSPPANVNVTTNYPAGNHLIIGGNISANNQISNANVEYKAVQSVVLLPGFSAISNVFKASIGNACN